MRILIAGGFAPFAVEPEDAVAAAIAAALRARGHEVDTIRVSRGGDEVQAAVAARLTDVSDVSDVLVAISRPAHLLSHGCKVIWCAGDAFAMAVSSADGDRAAFDEAVQVLAESPAARSRVLDWWDGPVVVADGSAPPDGPVDACGRRAR